MVNRIFLSVLLFLSLFIEGTIIPFPFVFVLGSILLLFYTDAISFISVFLISLLLDIVVPHSLGLTVLFTFGFQLVLYILQKPLSVVDPIPKLILLFFATILYQKVIGYPFLIALDLILFLLMAAWVKLSDTDVIRIRL